MRARVAAAFGEPFPKPFAMAFRSFFAIANVEGMSAAAGIAQATQKVARQD